MSSVNPGNDKLLSVTGVGAVLGNGGGAVTGVVPLIGVKMAFLDGNGVTNL
jgi:hypothetical protein